MGGSASKELKTWLQRNEENSVWDKRNNCKKIAQEVFFSTVLDEWKQMNERAKNVSSLIIFDNNEKRFFLGGYVLLYFVLLYIVLLYFVLKYDSPHDFSVPT